MRRVSVVGNSGSGKSTVSRALATQLGVPHVELDAINHQPGWTPLPREEFRARVSDIVSADGWVVDGNYSAVRDLVWGRADTIVWLDLPRRLVFPRVVRRTARRVTTGEELWNGNRERWQTLLTRNADENILLWSWTRHRPVREQYAALLAEPPHPEARVVRLRTPAAVAAFLAAAR